MGFCRSWRSRGLLAASLSMFLPACSLPQAAPAPETSLAVRGRVRDVAAFERFIATQPTPAEFRARYPDVTLVLPGDIATKELRMDNSRYFAQLDAAGQRIVGGKFM